MTLANQVEILNNAYERRMRGQHIPLDPLVEFAISVCNIAIKNQKSVVLATEAINTEMIAERGCSDDLLAQLAAQKELMAVNEKGMGHRL